MPLSDNNLDLLTERTLSELYKLDEDDASKPLFFSSMKTSLKIIDLELATLHPEIYSSSIEPATRAQYDFMELRIVLSVITFWESHLTFYMQYRDSLAATAYKTSAGTSISIAKPDLEPIQVYRKRATELWNKLGVTTAEAMTVFGWANELGVSP